MNKKQNEALQRKAKEAAGYAHTIQQADSTLRSWSRRKKEMRGDVMVSISGTYGTRWYAGVTLPKEVFSEQIVPVLKAIRAEARKRLAEMEP